jgi:hypothetical protein
MVYEGAVRYPMGWKILFSKIILKKCLLNWKSTNPPSLTKWKGGYYLNVESA